MSPNPKIRACVGVLRTGFLQESRWRRRRRRLHRATQTRYLINETRLLALARGAFLPIPLKSFPNLTSPIWSYDFAPLPYYAADENFIALRYSIETGWTTSAAHSVAQDPAIQAARVAMGVDQDPSLEGILQWFRWPLTWLEDEERQQRAQDRRRRKKEQQKRSEHSSPTSPSLVTVHCRMYAVGMRSSGASPLNPFASDLGKKDPAPIRTQV
ncbi:hypothetical protein B0H14DRAFT_2723652, partial [Mycena olivaceomarginata]